MKFLNKQDIKDLKSFLILWSTQSLSQLGSAITGFALTLWLYEKTGSALSTAALTICSYTPYILMSIFAGALSDRFDKKRTMLVCDTLAAVCTVTVLILYSLDLLAMWHLYAINAFSGLMNTVQQPASEVANTLLIPKEHYQKASGLQSLSRSLVSILNPLIATALYGLGGLNLVISVDLGTFVLAFCALLFFIKIPALNKDNKSDSYDNKEVPDEVKTAESVESSQYDVKQKEKSNPGVLAMAKEGLVFLKNTPLIFTLLLFMSGVNLVASAFDATLPGYVIPNPRGGATMLGIVTSCAGIAMIFGSLLVSVLPKPKDRVRVVYITMLISLGIENFLLAFTRIPFLWCLGQIIGWILVPVMSANLDVILRTTIPLELQGRVYACRNTFQFFTIPIGLFSGGIMVDKVCEPFMASRADVRWLEVLFGSGKGSGAALMMFILGVAGTAICLIVGQIVKKYHFEEE